MPIFTQILASWPPTTPSPASRHTCEYTWCQETCEDAVNQCRLASFIKETVVESCPWVSFYRDSDPLCMRWKRKQIDSSVSPRCASISGVEVNWYGFPQGLKLIRFVQMSLMRESPEFRFRLPVPKFWRPGSRLRLCVYICYKFVLFFFSFFMHSIFFLFHFYCIITKNKWGNSVTCLGPIITCTALLSPVCWSLCEYRKYIFTSSVQPTFCNSELSVFLGLGKLDDFPKENSNIKEQAASLHVLERYQRKGVLALCEEQSGGDACQTEIAGGSVREEKGKIEGRMVPLFP